MTRVTTLWDRGPIAAPVPEVRVRPAVTMQGLRAVRRLRSGKGEQ